ncbi:MAG: PAS domain-containing protein [Candidatus Hydrogenedentes bacterium]|nr:PAS domain-containing protein [Candidatus Hydrogenedentota bacterium]
MSGRDTAKSPVQRTRPANLESGDYPFASLLRLSAGLAYVARADASRTPLGVSGRLAIALGYSIRAKVPLQDFWDAHLHPSDADRVKKRWAGQSTRKRVRDPLEYRLLTKKGAIIWIHEESVLGENSDGAPRCVFSVLVDVTKGKEAEEHNLSQARDLRERVKELNCLYAITHLAEEGSVEQMLERVVCILPEAWQYPERAYARIAYAGRTFASQGACDSQWMQSASITIRGETVGHVEIGYRSLPAGAPESPFLPEEWSLLRGITRRLSDAIERIMAQEAVRKSEALYRTLAKNVPGALVGLFDRDLCCTLAEGNLRGILSKHRIEGLSLSEVWKDEPRFLLQACQRALEGHETAEEHRWHDLALSIHTLPIGDADGVRSGMFLVQDVTERRNLEKEVLEIAAREQRRIGQDLHDGLGQLLTGLMCLSGSLSRNLHQVAPSHVAEADEITQITRHAMTEVRALARGLMPVDLDSRGLAAALQELAYDCENLFNVACDCICDDPVRVEDPVSSLQLYRITQEAVSNAVRHGQASLIRIHLSQDPSGSGLLTIQDDGRGFRTGAKPGTGMGLRIMKYRAETIGGLLEVHSRRAKGTTIACRFPLSVTRQPPRTFSEER